jgi:hypothetical protein
MESLITISKLPQNFFLDSAEKQQQQKGETRN